VPTKNIYAVDMQNLRELEQALKSELNLLKYPPNAWILPDPSLSSENLYDVAIIGAGMAGLAASFALLQLGIRNIQLFDARLEGQEGPWATYARMLTLRSTKDLVGPALHTAHLTFEAWYKAQYGQQGWDQLYKIPTRQWMDYLRWYRQVLQLPVANEHRISLIEPHNHLLTLHLCHQGRSFSAKARKVVLATGRGAFGGIDIPSFMESVPRSCYWTTCDQVDFTQLSGKRVGIIGVGSSAFDAAAVALEMGCTCVELLTRRKHVPNVNKAASLSYPGFSRGYYQLDDEARWKIFSYLEEQGSPPPFESLDRIKSFSNVHVRYDIPIKSVVFTGQELEVQTQQNLLVYDHLILATGFAIDVHKPPELRLIKDHLMLWSDRPCAQSDQTHSMPGRFPYLGPHFEFKERAVGEAPYLKDLYCFNYAATLSHGLVSGDIPDIGVGAMRLAEGIVADFFNRHWQDYDLQLRHFNTLEFKEKDYPFL
jgi:cation diffusion facilitator CzcD-associated flavoprotein CzcO